MNNTEENKELTQADLHQFYGTENYHRLTLFKNVVFTDGMAYLANEANCYWLMNEIAAKTLELYKKNNDNVFIVVRLFKKGKEAVIQYSDGNNNILDQTKLSFTDFPLSPFQCYSQLADYDPVKFVIMLTTEY